MIKLRNSILAALGVLLVSSVLVAQSTRTGHATGSAVAVQIVGTPTVTVSGTTTVSDPSEPGKQPFQWTLSPNSGSSTFSSDQFTVPAGKELVIDYISAQLTQYPAGGYAYMYLTTTGGGNSAFYKVIPPSSTTVPFNQNLKIYADPGTVVTAQVTQSSGSSSGGNLIVSGHLVNVP